MKQKDIFLQTEGDAWYKRNKITVANLNLPHDDLILCEMTELLPLNCEGGGRILEIGCGHGTRLAWMQNNLTAQCFGIDPSAQAVAAARKLGVNAQQGTADALPFDNGTFDAVIFGFCLYLCDRCDLFRIAAEADRVLKSPGWLGIEDFFSPTPRSRAYHHQEGMFTYKMDNRSLFLWHPAYECMTHKVRHHQTNTYTDDPEEWVAVSVLRKY